MRKDHDDRPFMRRALRLAARGRGMTHPNPMVGAVLVRDGHVIGEGWHTGPGTPHAEVHAIGNASSGARGATLYVNLEPCSHQGRTPPCTDAIIDAGISRVVASCMDPNPAVNGRGFGILRKSDISVTVGLYEERAREMNRAFFHHAVTGTPYVTLKMASSLDGRIATAGGESKWITGTAARRAVHRMRAEADGVLVGAGTALADDPGLTVRHVRTGIQPRRIILDQSLRIPLDAAVVDLARDGRTLIIIGSDVDDRRTAPFELRGVRFVRLPAGRNGFSWPDLSSALVQEGVIHLLVEGGGETAAFFLRAGAACRVEIFLAAAFIGQEGVPSVGSLSLGGLLDAPRLRFVRSRRVGEDVQLTADVERKQR